MLNEAIVSQRQEGGRKKKKAGSAPAPTLRSILQHLPPPPNTSRQTSLHFRQQHALLISQIPQFKAVLVYMKVQCLCTKCTEFQITHNMPEKYNYHFFVLLQYRQLLKMTKYIYLSILFKLVLTWLSNMTSLVWLLMLKTDYFSTSDYFSVEFVATVLTVPCR